MVSIMVLVPGVVFVSASSTDALVLLGFGASGCFVLFTNLAGRTISYAAGIVYGFGQTIAAPMADYHAYGVNQFLFVTCHLLPFVLGTCFMHGPRCPGLSRDKRDRACYPMALRISAACVSVSFTSASLFLWPYFVHWDTPG